MADESWKKLDEGTQRWWRLSVLAMFRMWPQSLLAPEDVAANVRSTEVTPEATLAIVKPCVNALCTDGLLWRDMLDGGKWAYRLAKRAKE